MTRTISLITILLIISVSAFAQDSTKIISATKVSGGYRFEQNGKPLTLKSMETIMKDDAKAFDYLEKAKTSSTIANILGYTGGFLIGYPLGTAIGAANRYGHWPALAAGLWQSPSHWAARQAGISKQQSISITATSVTSHLTGNAICSWELLEMACH
jgi:hypothetical protein